MHVFPYDMVRIRKTGARLKDGVEIEGFYDTVDSEVDAQGFIKIGCHRINIEQARKALLTSPDNEVIK